MQHIPIAKFCQLSELQKTRRRQKVKPSESGDHHPEPQAFGELVTGDHATSLDEDEVSRYGDTVSSVLQGKATMLIGIFPDKKKGH